MRMPLIMPRPSAGKIVFIIAGIAVIAGTVWTKFQAWGFIHRGGGLKTMSKETLHTALLRLSLTMAPVPGTTTAPVPVPGTTAAPPANKQISATNFSQLLSIAVYPGLSKSSGFPFIWRGGKAKEKNLRPLQLQLLQQLQIHRAPPLPAKIKHAQLWVAARFTFNCRRKVPWP